MDAKRIYIGSWFQRTTLHLSEVYDFFMTGDSPLELDKKKLKKLRDNLNFEKVEDIHDDFEYISAVTKNGISLKIYEDGLITLSRDPEGDIKNDIEGKKPPEGELVLDIQAPTPVGLVSDPAWYFSTNSTPLSKF